MKKVIYNIRICKQCGEKFNLNQTLKSICKRDARIECEKCNSIFVLKKENIFTWILGFLSLYIVLSFSDKIGVFKGILLGIVIGVIGIIINLNLDSRYTLKNNK